METLVNNILYHYSYWHLIGLTIAYFFILYFGVGPIFLLTCKILERNNTLQKINCREISQDQRTYEIKQSVQSICVFGTSVIPIAYLVRTNVVQLLPDTWINVLAGLIMLTLWNEIHFYVVHRIMHQKFMMKHVHYIHHKSTIPTVFAVYSFHWVEAFLLSTVLLTIVPFIPVSIVAIFIYPLVSIMINFAGHCNYRFGDGKGPSWQLLGTHHHEHHSKGKKHYGFALNYLDKLFSKAK
jgi:Delta7-sterol 5-desaturase